LGSGIVAGQESLHGGLGKASRPILPAEIFEVKLLKSIGQR
jgi:hypothetical protein